ncbi:hypothetical protein [Bosea sp. WAO]|uniref:hypothetical protein n=1 Tax=Bosea sp. WAO TaxID=406341 RepID=UPI000829B629|nr:hypothetical protein [Bosea sp. WAO]
MLEFGKSRLALTAALAGGLLAATIAPVSAEQGRAISVDKSRLDSAQAEYSQYYYRRGWRYNRGAAVAAGVGLGILGAAAIAASRPAYAEPVYGYGYGYGYEPRYVYEEPVYVAPRRYYAPRYYGYAPDNIRDPAGGSYR